MPPKRRSLPFLFALSFAALFLLSYHYHSSTPFLPLTSPTFSSESSINPNPFHPSFSFTIKLLAFDRPASLRRCLRSLSAALYGPDRVDLHLFLDHLPVPAGGSDSPGRNVSLSHRILELVDAFEWKHGKKMVHYRTGNVGLQAQWLEAWWPASDDEFVFVVEDDLELSPLYYRFLKALIGRYYYDRENYSPSIYGASLQRPRFVAGKHGNKLEVDSGTHLFLYQMVGTWGQLLFPKPWKEFRLWYDVQKAKGSKPILQGMVTTGWYKKMGERIWTPWFIKFIHTRGYYNIYTNFLHDRALSTSHRDAGVNYGKAAGPDSYLLDESSLDFNLWEMQPLRNLKWYDFCFREVLPGRVVRSFDELGTVLNSLQKQKMVVFISLYRGEERITRNLLCHLERLSIQNYIFVGGDSRFFLDLARRGHAVIDADQLLNNARGYKLKALGLSDTKLAKEIWVKSSIIKKCLESGYDSWVIDVNMIPLSSSFFGLPDTSYNFMVAKDVELMFVKSTEGSVHVWTYDFILKVAAAVNSLLASRSVSVGQLHFVHFVSEALKEMGAATVWTFDESLFGVRIGINAANHTSLGSTKKIVLWSQHVGLDLIQRELVSMDMWLIDEDFSCSAVVCHG